jgi:GNAT superfamily N-acetyltransferase
MKSAFAVRPMRPGELDLALEWARQEGWNPGLDDAPAFYVADPTGFFVGVVGEVPVGCISVVKYGQDLAFVGLYMVHPDYRGWGFGKKLWDVGMASAEGRTIGLDGVVAQQDNYRRSGFEPAYRTMRYGGQVDIAVAGAIGAAAVVAGREVMPFSRARFEQVSRYDAAVFAAPRPAFLTAWCAGAKTRYTGLVRSSGKIRGYGTIRRCFDGHKIGPLFANTAETASAILASLVTSGKATSMTLDVPLANPAAVRLAESFGLVPVFETARMYRGTPPIMPLRRIFGVTTLELG